MNRLTIIKDLMTTKGLKNYLEIGVFNGHIFFRIKSNFKIAVDPEFRFDKLRIFGKTLLNPHNVHNKYYSKTSDAFFAEDAPELLKDKPLHIALIDGMHEYDYALRDVENTLKYLSDDGVIIMHDCNPLTKQAASSFQEWKDREFADTWNGDVWKVILHMQSVRDDVNAFTIDCDHGLGIITKRKSEQRFNFTKEQINSFTYEDFERHRKEWLNLKHCNYFYEYFQIASGQK